MAGLAYKSFDESRWNLSCNLCRPAFAWLPQRYFIPMDARKPATLTQEDLQGSWQVILFPAAQMTNRELEMLVSALFQVFDDELGKDFPRGLRKALMLKLPWEAPAFALEQIFRIPV
jgi:hypothetical protein